MFYQNRGMFSETLVNNTIEYYLNNNIAYFQKRHLPFSIIKKEKNDFQGKILAKAAVDYFGICDGKYYEFEVKETNSDAFLLSSLKKHQFQHLQLVNYYGGFSFLLLNFVNYDQIWIIPTTNLVEMKLQKITSIKHNKVKKYGFLLPISHPGIVDWLKICNKLILKKGT